jgi:GTP cyclohydrolase FolE2
LKLTTLVLFLKQQTPKGIHMPYDTSALKKLINSEIEAFLNEVAQYALSPSDNVLSDLGVRISRIKHQKQILNIAIQLSTTCPSEMNINWEGGGGGFSGGGASGTW